MKNKQTNIKSYAFCRDTHHLSNFQKPPLGFEEGHVQVCKQTSEQTLRHDGVTCFRKESHCLFPETRSFLLSASEVTVSKTMCNIFTSSHQTCTQKTTYTLSHDKRKFILCRENSVILSNYNRQTSNARHFYSMMACCYLKYLKQLNIYIFIDFYFYFVLSVASHTLRVENWELSGTCPTFHSRLGPNSATTKQQATTIRSQSLWIKTKIFSPNFMSSICVCQYDLSFYYYWMIKTAFISIHKGAVLGNILIYRGATKGNKALACVVSNCY